MKNESELDQYFRRKLRSHEETPPPEVWTQVSAQLPSRSRRWVAAAVVLCVLAGTLFTGYRAGWLSGTSVAQETPVQIPSKGWPGNLIHPDLSLIKTIPLEEQAMYPTHKSNSVNLGVNSQPTSQLPDQQESIALKARRPIELASLPFKPIAVELAEETSYPIKKQPEDIVLLKLPLHASTDALDSLSKGGNVYAYANQQIQHLLQGQKPNLPKFNREPILTINLKPFFNNN